MSSSQLPIDRVASTDASLGSQTRFSFYNADDFAVEAPVAGGEDAPPSAIEMPDNHVAVGFQPQTPREADRILLSRQDALYQEEIQARIQSRQERMAKYAHRLQELKEEKKDVETSFEQEAEAIVDAEAILSGLTTSGEDESSQEEVELEPVVFGGQRPVEEPPAELEEPPVVEEAPVEETPETEEPSSVAVDEPDELDDLMRRMEQVIVNSPPSKDDSMDRRVRDILSNDNEDDEHVEEDNEDEDDDDVDALLDDALDDDEEPPEESSASQLPDSEEDTSIHSSDGDAESNDSYESDDEPVLGPLNRKSGGTTGVVLEPDSPKRELSSPSSLLESMSAVMSLVTGSYSKDDREEDNLMRTLCAHLMPDLPQDKRPVWDESNPDEPGYRIVRLTKKELRTVEDAFDKVQLLIDDEVPDDSTFERDLKEAEAVLDREEKRLNAAEQTLDQVERGPQDGLKGFPGVKPTGRGEMGDLEYFHLPVIFKSNVTGFEPTKDMYLEQGNIVAGQYLVEGELGSAAFSTAYRCVDLGSDGDGHEEVCLKVIKNTKDFFDQSLDEIKILELLRQTGKCQENCIIEMKTFFYHREHLIIVTELLRQNLFEFGKFIIDHDEEPYFTMSRLSYITRQCLIALRFVHKLGLVHSDIKPENILLASYSRAKAKVIDFGSSCYLTDRQSSYIQSRSYRAPEVVLGLPYDGRIDVWSLGCVVAEMFTGEVTFQNDSVVSMLSRIEAICGRFPKHMVDQGRQSGHYFTRCGLLFEKVKGKDRRRHDSDSEEDESGSDEDGGDPEVDIFQPKITSLAARLGFAPDLLQRFDAKEKMSKEEKRQANFIDFVRKLLTIDPEKRPTAEEALKHPWMQYAAGLTEEDIKYPSN